MSVLKSHITSGCNWILQWCIVMFILNKEVVYRRHLKQLYHSHQHWLRAFLSIHWIIHIPDTEVLDKNAISIDIQNHREQLRYVGHVIRFSVDCIPLGIQLLCKKLSFGSRPHHKLKKWLKSVVKNSLAICGACCGMTFFCFCLSGSRCENVHIRCRLLLWSSTLVFPSSNGWVNFALR